MARRVWLWRVLMLLLLALAGACGGSDEPTEESVDGEWVELAPVPTPRTEVAAVSDGDLIHVIGGFDGGGATVSTVEVYDMGEDGWTDGPPLPIALNHAAAASLDGVRLRGL